MLSAVASYPCIILEHHLDSFGHVNHAEYLKLFEEARWDLITGNGYGLDHVLKTQLAPVILEVNVKYKRELKLRERIQIETWCESVNKKIIILGQRMRNSSQEVSSEAVITMAMFDLGSRRMISPTAEFLRAMGVSSLA